MVDPREPAWVTTLTGSGRGAVGVIAVWGPAALSVVDAAFRPGRGPSLSATAPGRLRLGRMGEGLGDEVVAVVLGGSPPAVEVHCHGGQAAVRLVTQSLRDAGADLTDPSEWALHHAGSPVRAEAMLDLASASTVRAASILLDQAQGALDRELARILDG